MTRAEATGAIAKALEAMFGCMHWRAVDAADVILDALLEAGMTFGEELSLGAVWTDADGRRWREVEPIVHRPQGESK